MSCEHCSALRAEVGRLTTALAAAYDRAERAEERARILSAAEPQTLLARLRAAAGNRVRIVTFERPARGRVVILWERGDRYFPEEVFIEDEGLSQAQVEDRLFSLMVARFAR